jgi:3-methyladenine DNA glycosylase/8-oxoguanine DNA glycosylase
MKFDLPARPPFNFLSVVRSHGWFQLAPFHFDEQTNTLHYILHLSSGRVVELKLRQAARGVNVEAERLNSPEKKEVTNKVTWMFGLDMDFSAFYAATHAEPRLARAKKQSLGRLLRAPTLFEDVIKTILTTNTLWATTRNMSRNLVNEFGVALSAGPNSFRPVVETENMKAFPTPEAIAASNPDVIKEKIRVGYRAPALHQLAVRVASGQFDLESLKTSSLSTLELRKELMQINGVGPYAAANLLMILGRSDFIPIDSSALSAVSNEWYHGKLITARQVEKRFERWGEFKGLAFWFWDWKHSGG